MFKKLYIFIIKSYLGPLVMTFFIALFVLLMQFLWKYIDDLVGKGLDWKVIAELLTYASAGLVPMALPLAILLASLMTFGNLGENYELTAIKSSGISLPRIMMPLVVLTVFICIGAFFFSNDVLPYTNLKTGSLLYDITHQRPELNIKEGAFNNDIDGYSIKINRKSKKTDMTYNLMIYDHTANRGNVSVTVADSGYLRVTQDKKYMVVVLFSGLRYDEVLENSIQVHTSGRFKPHRRDKFTKQTLILPLSGFDFVRTDAQLFRNNFQMLNLKQLGHAIDSIDREFTKIQKDFTKSLIATNCFKVPEYENKVDSLHPERQVSKKDVVINLDEKFKNLTRNRKMAVLNIASNYARSAHQSIAISKDEFDARLNIFNRHKIEWHRKFTLSFACFIFFFIGAPLGAIIRKGGLGMPVVISVVFFIAYYIISLSGEKFVREDILPASQGMWISSMVLLPLGVFLTYKATNDSVLLDIDTYLSFYKKIKLLRKKKN